jgi:hypothetical protein
MKTQTILVIGNNDSEKTVSLKAGLESFKHSSFGYEWFNGEPLYHGEPTTGFFEKQGISFLGTNRTSRREFREEAYGGVLGADGNVYSDADSGL